jgi:hypothetical protein
MASKIVTFLLVLALFAFFVVFSTTRHICKKVWGHSRDIVAFMPEMPRKERMGYPSLQSNPFQDSSAIDLQFSSLPMESGCHSIEKHFLEARLHNASFIYLESELFQQLPNHFCRMEEFGDSPSLGGVALFRNALIQGDRPPFVFDCNFVYVPSSCMSKDATNAYIQRIARINNVTMLDEAIMIYQFWGNAYFHSMVECLPRLAYVLTYLKLHPESKILAGSTHLCRNSQTLNQLLGLNNTWVPYLPSQSYLIKRLLIPSGTKCGKVQPKCVERLQRALDITQNLHLNDTDLHSKLSVVLQRRNSRKIINHEELLQALRSHLAHCCVVEVFDGTESLADTVALHRKAQVIVGPHGAGLSSAIFARRGSSAVVELHPHKGNWNGSQVNPCHQTTAKAAGLVTRLVQQTDGSMFGDFYVNISAALDAVDDVMETLQHLQKS